MATYGNRHRDQDTSASRREMVRPGIRLLHLLFAVNLALVEGQTAVPISASRRLLRVKSGASSNWPLGRLCVNQEGMSRESTARPATASASCSLVSMLIYGLGECASSLVMNSVFAFAMLYYTKALRLDPSWAGVAMSVSVFWEAITEPVMGHISDNTRSRWGRRHSYMFFGGLLMATSSYMIWAVPEAFRTNQLAIFWYLVAMNLSLRTGLSMFCIPYMALGFEICADYQGRSRLQAIRQIFNMAANLAGPAMAWSFFFQDRAGLRGTTVPANYLQMGVAFSLVTAFFVLLVVTGTLKWREDTRQALRRADGGWSRRFVLSLKQLLLDHNLLWVVVFTVVTGIGTVWVSSLQVFVYDDFMRFSADEKTFAHSSTMVGWALGAFFSVGLAKRFDKRAAVILGGLVSFAANGTLALLFLTGLVPPGTIWHVNGTSIPLATLLFVAFHASYWLGIGIALPVSTAMVADVSEVYFLRTGVKKDGGYSSIASLAIRLACSIGLITSGYCMSFIGYKVTPGIEAVSQTPQTIWRLGFVTFVAGAFMCLLAMWAIRQYPLTRRSLEELRAAAEVTQPCPDDLPTKEVRHSTR